MLWTLRARRKRSKELILKVKQTRLRSITLQGTIEKRTVYLIYWKNTFGIIHYWIKYIIQFRVIFLVLIIPSCSYHPGWHVHIYPIHSNMTRLCIFNIKLLSETQQDFNHIHVCIYNVHLTLDLGFKENLYQ